MNMSISEAFNQLLREKRLDKELLMETLRAGFSSAVKKKFGATAEVEVSEDSRGNFELHLLKKVVRKVESPVNEITLAEAKRYKNDAKVGDTIKIVIPFSDFGRNAIQITKQILMQKIREFERERTYDEYQNRIGDIVSGSVQQIDRNGILVNLGNAEATLPKREQIRRERYNQGSSVRACIMKVDKEAKGPMITLSRTSPEFLKKLFGQEVPEIYEGIIEIKSVAREAGGRSKIAVYSRDDRVDAVGACVGMKGSRVQAVVNELSGERIDIVPWNEDVSAFVGRALSPAKISSVRVSSENKKVLVIVEEDQLSLAIGKDGQNVRLASKLTGWDIELTTSRELEQRERLQESLMMSIEEMVGVTARIAEKLKSAGITTVQKLVKASEEELLALPGLGPKTVAKLKETAEGTMKELDKALEELIEKENEERLRAKEQEKPLFDESVLEAHGEEEPETKALTEEALFGKTDEETGEETAAAEVSGVAAVGEVTEDVALEDEAEEAPAVEDAATAVEETTEEVPDEVDISEEELEPDSRRAAKEPETIEEEPEVDSVFDEDSEATAPGGSEDRAAEESDSVSVEEAAAEAEEDVRPEQSEDPAPEDEELEKDR